MDETVQYLRNEYEDVNRQWLENEARREAELNNQINFLNQQDKRDMDPMLAAGIGGIYGRDPFQEYQRARLPGIQREGTRRGLTNEHLAAKEKSLADLREKVMARMNAARAAAEKAANYKSDMKVIGDAGVVWDPNTSTVEEVYRNERNSPLYGKLYDTFLVQSLKPELRFDNDEQRLAWVINKTEAAMKAAKATDKTRIGSPDPYPTEGGAHRPGMDPNVLPKPVQFRFTPDQIAKFNDPAYLAHVKKSMLPEEATQFDAWLKVQAPTLAQPTEPTSGVPAAKTTSGSPELKTPGNLEFEKTGATNWANISKGLEESIRANESKSRSYNTLEAMLLSGNLPSGPLHEPLKLVGALASTYDPSGELAKKYGNNAPAYFSELMNLVRADIKALGAGTAVSNLDLIVSQMAAGDLRNSPQGNLRLAGLQKYVTAEKAAHDKQYMQYIAKHQDGTNFLTGEKIAPAYALRRKPNSKGLESYELYTRDQYEKDFAKKFNGKKPSAEQWKDYSKRSIELMFSGEEYAKR